MYEALIGHCGWVAITATSAFRLRLYIFPSGTVLAHQGLTRGSRIKLVHLTNDAILTSHTYAFLWILMHLRLPAPLFILIRNNCARLEGKLMGALMDMRELGWSTHRPSRILPAHPSEPRRESCEVGHATITFPTQISRGGRKGSQLSEQFHSSLKFKVYQPNRNKTRYLRLHLS